MEDKVLDALLGQQGGIFAAGMFVGVALTLVYIAPKLYGSKISDLEQRINALELELKPYREFKDQRAMEALHGTRQGGV